MKKKRLFRLNLVTSVSHLICIIKCSGVPLPALHSNSDYISIKLIKTSWENALLMIFFNGVEKYEIEVTKMDQNYFLLQCST